MNLILAGRTFLLRDRRMGEHLWFVVTDPDPVTAHIVVVALVSEKAHTDKTTRLQPGDHAFIRHPSNVDYGTATFRPATKLQEHLGSGRAILREDMTPELLARVRNGLLASAHTPNVVVEHCRARFETPAPGRKPTEPEQGEA